MTSIDLALLNHSKAVLRGLLEYGVFPENDIWEEDCLQKVRDNLESLVGIIDTAKATNQQFDPRSITQLIDWVKKTVDYESSL